MTPAIIRRAGAEDVEMLAALRRLFSEEKPGGSIVDDDFDQRFAEWWGEESDRRIMWLALIDGTPVGMLNLAVFTRMPWPGARPRNWGYIANAFVHPGHRNEGIGRRLVAAAVDHARANGYARLVLHPSERAIPMYQRAGFGSADMLLVWQPEHHE